MIVDFKSSDTRFAALSFLRFLVSEGSARVAESMALATRSFRVSRAIYVKNLVLGDESKCTTFVLQM